MSRGRQFNSSRINHVGALASLVTLSFTAPVAALAQDASVMEEVVVTGYRESLSKALDIKRESVGAIDAIVAEDIADFPDANLSESIQRVPGVSLDRDAGEGRRISVRGLGPQFTRVRINGMEALTTTGSTDASGGTNRDRSFDFNVFASELFNAITVRKTASADVEEGSLGATVDLQVGHPFDYQGFTMVGTAQAGYNDLADKVDPRGAFLISNTFADNTLGALLSVAYTRRHLQEEGASTVRWQSSIGTAGAAPTAANTFQTVPAGYTAAGLSTAFRPRIPRYDYYTHDQERIGVTASLQFKPSDATELTLDALYSKFDAERTEAFIEAPNFSSSINQVDVLSAEVDGTNTLVYGVFDDVDVRSEQRFDKLSTKFLQVTLDGKQKLGDTLTLHGLIGRADSKHRNPIQTTLLWDHNDMDGYVYDYRGDSRLPLISYGNNAVTDPNFWTLTQIRLRPQTADNTFDNVAVDLKWEMNDDMSLQGGLQYKKYEFETTDRRRASEAAPAGAVAIPASSYANVISIDSLSAPAGTTLVWAVPNLGAAASLMNFYDGNLYPLDVRSSGLNNNQKVEEKDSGAFVQFDFKTSLFDRDLRGNIGVRYVRTKLKSQGFSLAGVNIVPVEASRTYSDTLPSLNLTYNLADDLVVRLGAAKVMARPGLGSLNPGGGTVSVAGSSRTASAGNPNLDPFRAKAYDIGLEWYFSNEAVLGAALFYKDITTYVQTVRTSGVFSDNPFGLPVSVAQQACVAGGANTQPLIDACVNSSWDFSVPRNTPGGPLKGVEVNFQTPFSFLPGIWKNFGAVLNYTYVQSEIKYVNTTGRVVASESLLNLSKNAANATLYFDNQKFSARVSAAYRSDYRTQVPGSNGITDANGAVIQYGNNVHGTAGVTTLDFSSSYQLNDHATLTLEALNLTDEFQDQWIDSNADRSVVYHHTGRTFMIGGRYKF